MKYHDIDEKDRELIRAASDAIERNYSYPRHMVGSALLASSGKVYVGVNVESCGYGPCAEPIAMGRAITDGERTFERVVAVKGPSEPRTILPPCGNCRQLLVDYAPDCWVILTHDSKIVKVKAKDLIPDAYGHFD